MSAHLYDLLTSEKCWEDEELGYDARTLVSIAFSLWRAAFLADRSGELADTNDHSVYFLGEMLDTNAINFAQDKRAKAFTFNYYLANVRFRLAEFKADNTDFIMDPRLSVKGGLSGVVPTDKWELYQKAFKDAVTHFETRLKGK